jgi:hypothetical protein
MFSARKRTKRVAGGVPTDMQSVDMDMDMDPPSHAPTSGAPAHHPLYTFAGAAGSGAYGSDDDDGGGGGGGGEEGNVTQRMHNEMVRSCLERIRKRANSSHTNPQLQFAMTVAGFCNVSVERLIRSRMDDDHVRDQIVDHLNSHESVHKDVYEAFELVKRTVLSWFTTAVAYRHICKLDASTAAKLTPNDDIYVLKGVTIENDRVATQCYQKTTTKIDLPLFILPLGSTVMQFSDTKISVIGFAWMLYSMDITRDQDDGIQTIKSQMKALRNIYTNPSYVQTLLKENIELKKKLYTHFDAIKKVIHGHGESAKNEFFPLVLMEENKRLLKKLRHAKFSTLESKKLQKELDIAHQKLIDNIKKLKRWKQKHATWCKNMNLKDEDDSFVSVSEAGGTDGSSSYQSQKHVYAGSGRMRMRVSDDEEGEEEDDEDDEGEEEEDEEEEGSDSSENSDTQEKNSHRLHESANDAVMLVDIRHHIENLHEMDAGLKTAFDAYIKKICGAFAPPSPRDDGDAKAQENEQLLRIASAFSLAPIWNNLCGHTETIMRTGLQQFMHRGNFKFNSEMTELYIGHCHEAFMTVRATLKLGDEHTDEDIFAYVLASGAAVKTLISRFIGARFNISKQMAPNKYYPVHLIARLASESRVLQRQIRRLEIKHNPIQCEDFKAGIDVLVKRTFVITKEIHAAAKRMREMRMTYPQIASAVYYRFYNKTPKMTSKDKRMLADMLRKGEKMDTAYHPARIYGDATDTDNIEIKYSADTPTYTVAKSYIYINSYVLAMTDVQPSSSFIFGNPYAN